MNTYVALLRGINVGGNNKVEMAKLKPLFESLGHTNVVTYINSGNVIFKTRKRDVNQLIDELQKGIKKTFKLDVPVVLRTQKSIEKVCNKTPSNWTNDKDSKTDVMFLWDQFASRKTLNLISTNPKIDFLLYIDGAIVWHLKKKDYGKSKMNEIIGTELYEHMTVRNINTVRKLDVLMKNLL